jgi:hypothetical protein
MGPLDRVRDATREPHRPFDLEGIGTFEASGLVKST